MGQQANPSGAPRFRLGLSDGQLWVNTILTSQLTELVLNGAIADGQYLRINESQVQDKGGKK